MCCTSNNNVVRAINNDVVYVVYIHALAHEKVEGRSIKKKDGSGYDEEPLV